MFSPEMQDCLWSTLRFPSITDIDPAKVIELKYFVFQAFFKN